MIGILLLTHNNIGKEMVSAINYMLGTVPNLKALSLDSRQDEALMRKKVELNIRDVNKGHGVVLVTDVLGGSASNIAISFLSVQNIEVISGLSLPLLLKLIEYREQNMSRLVAYAQREAQKAIHVPSQLLSTFHQDLDLFCVPTT